MSDKAPYLLFELLQDLVTAIDDLFHHLPDVLLLGRVCFASILTVCIARMFEDPLEFLQLVLKVFHPLVVLLDILNKLLDVYGQLTGLIDNGNNARYRTEVSVKEPCMAGKIGFDMTSRLTSDLHARRNDC